MSEWLDTVFGVTGGIWSFVQILILAIIIGLIIVYIVFLLQHKHRVRVRIVVGGKTLVFDDRAKEIKDKEGVLKWKLLKRKHCLPVPPKEAIHLTNKGKYSVEAYYLPEGEYKYAIDNGVDEDNLTHFEPLDTGDREFYASEMREAEQYRKKDWKEFLLPLAGVFSVLIILILMLVFWEDIAKPGIQIVDKAAEIAAEQQKTMEIMRDIIQDRQTIDNIDVPINNDAEDNIK